MTRLIFLLLICFTTSALSQVLTVYQRRENERIDIDGTLDEVVWAKAGTINGLIMVEPEEGASSDYGTKLMAIADHRALYLGIRCLYPDPGLITSSSKSRDSSMRDEDYIKFVFDTASDGRTGYIFAINPDGTRYDALVSNFGEGENPNWDCLWNAKTRRDARGWTAEVVIPIRSLSYPAKAKRWGFNFERKIQRNMEIQRWTGIKADYKVGQVIHAGELNGLPKFDPGIGLNVKISGIGLHADSASTGKNSEIDYSIDLTQKITGNISTQLTVNTDFAETEVDTRSTNLTRFPLYFPEKRSFFLEGTDIFDFGLGTGTDVIPFFSRRIGLVGGEKVPLRVGAKLNGKLSKTSFGALLTRTGNVPSLAPGSTMGAFRIKQNILKESSVGIIGTVGDPKGRDNSWLLGMDITFQTSTFMKNKNFLAGFWALFNNNPGLTGDQSALGLKIDYPNDLWDVALTAKRIGDSFSPSLGFVPRRGIYTYSIGADYMPRPDWSFIRQFFFESRISLVTNLDHRWESYQIFTAPVHFLLESGDRFEFNIVPNGENLPTDFEISDGVVIQAGPYHWCRYRLEYESAAKRPINGQVTWWFGSFYDGFLDQIELELKVRPSRGLSLSLTYERNMARLQSGKFTQDLFGSKIQLSLASNLELSSFIQYDNETRSVGSNFRLRWTLGMHGELFIVYNHNIDKFSIDRRRFDSSRFIIKFSYNFGL